MRGRFPGRLAWALFGAAAALVVGTAVLHVVNRHLDVPITRWWVTNATIAIGLGLPGALVASRRPRNPIGWVLLGIALGDAVTAFGREYAIHAILGGAGWPGAAWAAWAASWGWVGLGLLGAVFALFPEGRTRSPLRLGVVALAVVSTGILVAGEALPPGPLFPGASGSVPWNPVGWHWAAHRLDSIGFDPPLYAMFAALGAGIAAMLARLPRAPLALRRQLLVVLPPAILVTAETIYENWGSDTIGAVTSPIVVSLFAAAVAVAVLRYGLYEIDLILNRALVYATLSALLVGAYVATVLVADAALGSRGIASSLLGAALVAVLFAPLRLRLQHGADRLLYGERRDPYAVISTLGERLPETDAALPALAETVARTLKLPHVAIELEREGVLAPAAVHGAPRGEPLVLPLVYQGAVVGRLTLGRRAPSDAFTRAEQRLFEDIARQVAVAAHAVLLTEDLQRSRERLVNAREEERRRVRRDLHDGLGPTLAGIALQLDAARELMRRDPAAADELVQRLVAETQAAIADVRRVVYDLRPPALDELGLVPALRQQAARFPGLSVEVDAPERIDGLPAAVEVAAYRIATEAVTNVARHAGAGRCVVRLCVNGALELEIADDGRGMGSGWRSGVGVASMDERAAELGGTCTLDPAPGGGTVVRAKLPLPS